MKPTKEIIELSRKLCELGHKQEISEGDWYLEIGDVGELKDEAWLSLHRRGDDEYKVIPIPSLEDGFEFLVESCGDIGFGYTMESSGIVFFRFELQDEKFEVIGGTPHEAVLMAMVRVLKQEG